MPEGQEWPKQEFAELARQGEAIQGLQRSLDQLRGDLNKALEAVREAVPQWAARQLTEQGKTIGALWTACISMLLLCGGIVGAVLSLHK